MPARDAVTDAFVSLPRADRRRFIQSIGGLAVLGVVAPTALAGLARVDRRLDGFQTIRGVGVSVSFNTGGNSLMLPAGDRVLLVDAKFVYLAEALRNDALSMLDEDRRPSAEVVLVNTHHHADHTAGNLAFVGRGATYAQTNAVERVRGMTETFKRAAAGGPGQIRRVFPDREDLLAAAVEVAQRLRDLEPKAWVPETAVEQERTLQMGEQTVELTHFGSGHTDNDLVVRVPGLNVLHTGDLVFRGYFPFCDPDGGVKPSAWIEVLKQVRAMCDNDTLVVPGHGDPGGPDMIDTQRAYFEQLFEAVQQEIEKGTERGAMRPKTWPFMDGLGFERIRTSSILAVYDELMPLPEEPDQEPGQPAERGSAESAG